MTKAQREIRQRKIRQRIINRSTRRLIIANAIVILLIMIATLYLVTSNMEKVQVTNTNEEKESKVENAESIEVEEYPFESSEYPTFTYSKDWDAEDSYLLARIAMAEAEGCNTQTKTLIIMCVLNRVWSDEFPDTIEEVIFQENQFSPIDNGRWDRVEPNEDCYEAVKVVMEAKYDYSGGATYFENCADEDNWHSRNLEFLYESEGIRFYK